MKENFIESESMNQTGFVRLGGVLIILGLIIHIIANIVLKTFPSENLTLSELEMYLSDEKGTWAIVHGMRYIAIVCIIIFSAGLFVKTCRTRTSLSLGWGIVGLLGTALMMTNLMITNGIEILTFYDFNRLSGQKELFWLFFSLTRVLFSTEIIAWAILILGFSMAGWLSATIPKWLVVLGLFSALLCLLSAIFIVNILNGGWATILGVGSLTGLLWFICVGFYMIRRTQ